MKELTEWYVISKCLGAPKFERVSASAKTVRNRHTARPVVNDFELLSLVYNTLRYCFAKFDTSRGNLNDDIENRFMKFFNRKLWSVIFDFCKRQSCRRLPQNLTCPESNNVAIVAIRDAVAELPVKDRNLVHRLYWCNQTLSEIARDLNIGKSTVNDRKERILATLKLSFVQHYNILSLPNVARRQLLN